MQVRYFRIFAYVVEIHRLVYDACTHSNKSAHTYVFALNVPYCTCETTHSTQNRFCILLIIYCCLLWYVFAIGCLHHCNWTIFRVLLRDFKGYRQFIVLHEEARILLHQTTAQLDAYVAHVLLFTMWSSLICCFIIN